MLKEFVECFCAANETCEIIETKLRKGLNKMETSTEEFVDLLYALKETMSLLDSQAKNLRRLQKTVIETLCKEYALQVQTSEGALIPRSYKTEWCTGTPMVDFGTVIPKPGQEEYDEVLKWLGCPDHLIQSHIIKHLSYNNLRDAYIAARSKGCPLPPNFTVDDMIPRYQVRIRKRKDLLDECSNTSLTKSGTETKECPDTSSAS